MESIPRIKLLFCAPKSKARSFSPLGLSLQVVRSGFQGWSFIARNVKPLDDNCRDFIDPPGQFLNKLKLTRNEGSPREDVASSKKLRLFVHTSQSEASPNFTYSESLLAVDDTKAFATLVKTGNGKNFYKHRHQCWFHA